MTEPVRTRRLRGAAGVPTPGRRAVLVAFLVLVVVAIGLTLVNPGGAEFVAPAVDRAAPRSAIDAAWYCADGTSNAGGRADETVLIANLADSSAAVTVEVATAGKRANKELTVDGNAVERVKVSDIAASPDPGVTVYARGGQIVVEHQLTGANDLAVGPCARQPGASWYFAAGTTVKGAFEWLALYNPFPEGALVDVEVFTKDITDESEAARPVERINSINVPGYTRVSLPIHERIGRHSATALAVRARFGRVVAERSLVFDNVDGRSGLALSLGTPTIESEVVIAGGRAAEGRSEVLAIANPGTVRATATVEYLFEGGLSIEPATLDIDAGTVANLVLPTAPKDRYRALAVRSSAPIVAEVRATSGKPQSSAGIATVIGDGMFAREQVVVAPRVSATSNDHYVMVNPSSAATIVSIRMSDGSGEAAQFEIGPRGVVEFAAKDVGATPKTAMVISSARPIAVGRDTDATGITLSTGIAR